MPDLRSFPPVEVGALQCVERPILPNIFNYATQAYHLLDSNSFACV